MRTDTPARRGVRLRSDCLFLVSIRCSTQRPGQSCDSGTRIGGRDLPIPLEADLNKVYRDERRAHGNMGDRGARRDDRYTTSCTCGLHPHGSVGELLSVP
jgi:hypothetical protein